MTISISFLTVAITIFSCSLVEAVEYPLSAGVYANPVQSQRDSPDPGVNKFGDRYYAVTTMGWEGNYFPIWQSKDLTNWTHIGWVINKGQVPGWTKCCDYWAPQIHFVNGKYMVYYTAKAQNDKLSIGVRHSLKIQGPYTDINKPLMTNSTQGVIDATIAIDESSSTKQLYLIYKVDGNSHGAHTPIYAIKLKDGLQVQGEHHFLITNDRPWEGGVVQAPWVVYRDNFYYLFYSGNGYDRKQYAVGIARSKNLLGPYEKFQEPILHTKASQTAISWQGPGHCSVLKGANGNWAIVYHAWPHGKVGTIRLMLLDELKWNQNQWPTCNNGSPSQDKTPIP